MNPLRFTPSQWRALRYLATYSASAARAGFLATRLHAATDVTEADLSGLANLGHLTGRLHGSTDAPSPSTVRLAPGHRKLRIYLTPTGKSAAEVIEAAHRGLRHLHVYGAFGLHGPCLPAAALHHDAGVGDDTLTRLQRHGLVQVTPGEYLAWTTSGGATVLNLYGPPRTADTFGRKPCQHCGTPPPGGARIWRNTIGGLYCDPCARHYAGASPTALITLTSTGRRYAEPYTAQEAS